MIALVIFPEDLGWAVSIHMEANNQLPSYPIPNPLRALGTHLMNTHTHTCKMFMDIIINKHFKNTCIQRILEYADSISFINL